MAAKKQNFRFCVAEADAAMKSGDDGGTALCNTLGNSSNCAGLNPQADLYIPQSILDNSRIASAAATDPYFGRYLSSLDYIAAHCDILELISRLLPLSTCPDVGTAALLDGVPAYLTCPCMGAGAGGTAGISIPELYAASRDSLLSASRPDLFPIGLSAPGETEIPPPASCHATIPTLVTEPDEATRIARDGIPVPPEVLPVLYPNSRITFQADAVQVTTYGTISLSLRHRVQVDITLDKAIRMVNNSCNCIAAISSTGDNCCILHPFARVLQEDDVIHIESGRQLAKISRRGIAFTSLTRSLVYLVDASGTKSTAEKFRDLQEDCSINVFYDGSDHGREAVESCYASVREMNHRIFPNGDETWVIAGVFVKQTAKGDVRVAKISGQYVLKTSVITGTISVVTPTVYMLASKDPDEHLTVRQGAKQVKSSDMGFNVRNGSQKAGFDNFGEIILA